MKKKISAKDLEDWNKFINSTEKVYQKDKNQNPNNLTSHRIVDLHGFSLNDANKIVRKFIIDSSNIGCKKVLIITGKGLRSKVYNNPYLSEKMNVLKNSIPDFINNDADLSSLIIKTSKADKKHGGDGAFYIFLKQK